MNSQTKWKVAKILGAGAVGLGAAMVIKKGFGAAFDGSVAGGALVLIAHELLNAPVSGWIYNQI